MKTSTYLDMVFGLIVLCGLCGSIGYMLGRASACQADYERRLAQDRLAGRVIDLSVEDIQSDWREGE